MGVTVPDPYWVSHFQITVRGNHREHSYEERREWTKPECCDGEAVEKALQGAMDSFGVNIEFPLTVTVFIERLEDHGKRYVYRAVEG